MPEKLNVEALLRRQLGKETGDAILAKIDKMILEKKTPSQIQRVVMADIQLEIEKAVVSTVIAQIGPITPIKVKPLQAAVRSKTALIRIAPQIGAGIMIRHAPMPKGAAAPYAKGQK